MAAKTAFGAALDSATLLAWEHAMLSTPKACKLSVKGFLDQIQKAHRGSLERAIMLRSDVDSRPDLGAIATFIRGLSRALATPNYPALPADLSRLARTFGDETLLRGSLSDAKYSLADAVVVAIEDAAEASPEAFGTATNFHVHQRKVADARGKLDAALRTLAASLTMDELIVDVSHLTSGERARGLVRLTLRCAPTLAVGPGWETALVEHQLRVHRAAAA